MPLAISWTSCVQVKIGIILPISYEYLFFPLGVGKKQPVKYLRNDEQLKAIGEKIRKYRRAKSLSQTELAFECGDKDWSQISRMERGLVNFSISYLFTVAEVLEISPKELLP
ncbi:MAG: helix-turn-helix transcriptional regulator [Ferruginibacter sp.]|nr:helix-turn-helix transcriptional regulator [Ferruginibacter sp.]